MHEPRRVRLSAPASGVLSVRTRPAHRTPLEAAKQPLPTPPIEGTSVAPAAPGKRPANWKKRIGLALGAVSLAVVGYVAWVGIAFVGLERTIYQPRPATPTIQRAVSQALGTATSAVAGGGVAPTEQPTPDPLLALPPGRLNILVMGTDKRPNDPDHYARSDTMILLNLDPQNKKVAALTIPRDLVAEIPGYGVNKINSAYLFGEYYHEPGGGQALAARTISQLFNVPIDYYLTINFEGFRRLIDLLGGIDIDVPYAIDDYHYPSDDEGDNNGEIHVHFDAGWQHMDGKTALRYARTRHADNDFMRSRRQLQVMVAARQSAMSLNLIPRLPSIIDQLSGMVETDIPFDQQLSLAHFAYDLKSTDITTATIGSDLIYPVTLDDGSEGLKLDWSAAGPMLDSFFGRSEAQSSYPESGLREKGTPSARQGNGNYAPDPLGVGQSPTTSPAATRTPTHVPKGKATRGPVATATTLP